MPIDPQDGGPDDWIAASPAPSAVDDGPDDWIAPAAAAQDPYPDDWIPAAPSVAPAQSAAGNQSAARATSPDPFTATLATISVSRAGVPTWAPPTLSGSPGWSSLSPNLPPLVAPPSAANGILRALARMPTSDGTVPGDPLYGLFGGPSWSSSNPASSFQWRPDSWAQPNWLDQSASVDGLGLSPRVAVQRASLETGDAGQSGLTPPFGSSLGPNGPSGPNVSDSAGDSSAPGNTPNPDTNLDEPGSVTRLIRDSSGKPLAILRLQPDQANASPSGSWSDAQPDGVRAGDRYAQIIQKLNTAVTGNPVIDRTTGFLLDALEQSVLAMGSGSGNVFGTKVHTDFARRVKALDLPGIGQTGVEQSFDFDWERMLLLRPGYGAPFSIRTDVALSDPKSPDQRPIAVYDLKTGNAVLTPAREAQLRDRLGQRKDLPIIVLEYKTGNAIFPRR